MSRRIVAAACRVIGHEKWIFVSARHFDPLMHQMIDNSRVREEIPNAKDRNWEQGFIDNFQEFVSRRESWKIALSQDQIKHRCGGDDVDGGTLYSENLY